MDIDLLQLYAGTIKDLGLAGYHNCNKERGMHAQPEHPPTVAQEQSIADLLRQLVEASRRMSAHNSHREVLEQAITALREITLRLHREEHALRAARGRLRDVARDMADVVAQAPPAADGTVAVVQESFLNAIRAWHQVCAQEGAPS